jgi:mRNA-degrading endonuclease RelE of RelBE toxin-antitoxin system
MDKILNQIKKLDTETLEKLYHKVQFLLLDRMFPKDNNGKRHMRKANDK